MKKLTRLPLCLGCVLAVSTSYAIDLKQSKVTQVVNDVQIISATDQQQKAVAVNDIFSMPDILRTGPASRAELIAADETVTRVGANTIFSFDPATRTIDLKQGSLLFHSPHGKGGGTIHTGSATASVLGTTLIVTTTPNGGMKVLDLEGKVEVKFLNGLHQTLAPGHMTMVMPGGSQLTPIIIFRLDDVTKNGQLVKGFNGPLSSMPLIQQQIDKQLKAIADGKLSSTGQILDANGNPIQTLPASTLPNAFKRSGIDSPQVLAAFAEDATVNPVSLNHVFLNAPDAPFVILNNTFYTGQPFFGFVARNITFQNSLPPVDLSQYANLGEFDFVGAGNITFDGSVNFNGLEASRSIIFSLVAGKQIIVAPGSTIRANVANFDWQTPQTITFDNVNVFNDTGNTSFGTGGSFVTQNNAYLRAAANLTVLAQGNIQFNNSTLGADSGIFNSAKGTVSVNSTLASFNSFAIFTGDQGVSINGSTINANGDVGHIAFNSKHGSVNISGTSISTGVLAANAGDSITLDGANQSLNASSVALTAANQASINNANLSGFAYMNVAAKTITVMDTTFATDKSYNFGTSSGQVNVNNGVNMGQLNLISDSIGNTAITSASQVDTTTGPSTGAGIHSYSLNPAAPKAIKVKTPVTLRAPTTFASTR